MASTKKSNKRGWKQSLGKPKSLMERLAALAAKQANENERTGRTK